MKKFLGSELESMTAQEIRQKLSNKRITIKCEDRTIAEGIFVNCLGYSIDEVKSNGEGIAMIEIQKTEEIPFSENMVICVEED